MSTPGDLEEPLRRSLHHVREQKKAKMSNQAIQKVDPGALAAQVVIQGDLSGLSDGQLSTYYVQLCESLALNPSTRPFTLLKLNGKLMMYANKDCSDQLRHRDKVSIRVTKREEVGDLMVVTAQAQLPDGRVDECIGALSIKGLAGEAKANALMKCETKAKRRVTLSICGLGFPDETEVDDIAAAAAASDQGTGGAWGQHGDSPDANPAEVDPVVLARAKKFFADCDLEIFSPACTWETMNKWRSLLGRKGEPTELGKSIADVYRGNISESDRRDIGKAWNRVERKLTDLEAKLKPPPVEASFVDPEPDGSAGATEREPGEDDDW